MSYIHMKYISVQGGDFNMQHFLMFIYLLPVVVASYKLRFLATMELPKLSWKPRREAR